MTTYLNDVCGDRALESALHYEDDVIRVIVSRGEDVKMFNVHERLLRINCDFFDAALRKEWAEGQSKTVQLSHEEPEIFRGFAHWLYTRRLTYISHETDQGGNAHVYLAKMYVLGEKLIATSFQNAVIDAMALCAKIKKTIPTGHSVVTIYKGTPENSPARKLLVDLHVRYATTKSHLEILKEVPEFVYDFAAAMAKDRARPMGGRFKEVEDAVARSYHKTVQKDHQ